MKKMVGYILSIGGLGIMALGLGTFKLDIGFLNNVSSSVITGVGVAGIIAGVVISLMDKSGKKKQSSEEVPIYEGTGKNRKIVGYQRG
jgi:hypothetical protein